MAWVVCRPGWLPSRHLEVSTRAAYRSYLDRHFLPFFGHRTMRSISASTVQAWVTEAAAGGLSPRSLGKYHVMLHGIFKRAMLDRVILHNPCTDTELPKVPPRKVRILSPEEFDLLFPSTQTKAPSRCRATPSAPSTGSRARAGRHRLPGTGA
jgi:site-specific recombinase XerD